MATISEALAVALQHHQAGRLPAAEQIYRQVLAAEPNQPEALHLLGVMAHQVGKHEIAAEYISRAIELNGGKAAYHNNLGLALQAQGKLDAAVACFRRALQLKLDYPEAHYNLGNVFQAQGKLDEAIACFQRALALKPDYFEAHYNLGNALQSQAMMDEAVACYRRALQQKPDYAEALNNLGNALKAQGKLDDAIACLRQALELKPDCAEVHNDLGNAMRDLDKLDEAVACFHRALELRPSFAEAHYNLGTTYHELGNLDAAVECYRRALELRPDYTLAHNNLGNVYKDQGKLDEAIASYNEALRFEPDSASTHWNRALTWLQSGDYERGWAEYEWRWQCETVRPRSFEQPLWDGTPLEGRTILLHCEQGFGDTFQFIRYVPLVKERGGRVLLNCPPRLQRLLNGLPGVDQLLVEGQELPAFDVHIPLMGLPHLFKTTLATIPAAMPYLRAEAARVEKWRARLPSPAFRIGVVWQGNPQYKLDRHRSFPMDALAPLAALPGVQLISLQKEHGPDTLRSEPPRFPLKLLGDELDADVPFADTAALMTLLDLVVTADTAAAHLAGALAAPVWVALPVITDWRWLPGRDDTPWYPTMRLFHQRTLGDWEELFARMALEVEHLLERRRVAAIVVPTTPGELLDKLTILAIKSERITEAAKRAHIRAERTALEAVRAQYIGDTPAVKELTAALQAVNETLWQAEDDIRMCERMGDFGPRFIELARSIYHSNDERSRLKRCLNDLLGAAFSEQKAYVEYKDSGNTA